MQAIGDCVKKSCGSQQDAFEAAFQQAGIYCAGLEASYQDELLRVQKRGFYDLIPGSYVAFGGSDPVDETSAVTIRSWPRFWKWWGQVVHKDGKWRLGQRGWNYLQRQPGWNEWQAYWQRNNAGWDTWSADVNKPTLTGRKADLKKRDAEPAREHVSGRPSNAREGHGGSSHQSGFREGSRAGQGWRGRVEGSHEGGKTEQGWKGWQEASHEGPGSQREGGRPEQWSKGWQAWRQSEEQGAQRQHSSPRRSAVFRGPFKTVLLLVVGCLILVLLRFLLHGSLLESARYPTARIPRRIWQSWKVDALHFENRDLQRARTWTRLNPHHRYELLTDDGALEYVETNFGPEGINRPDIVETYKALSLNLRIIQSDLLRYMIMYIDGGIWADIDVSALKPVRSWIPRGFDEHDIDMVIGIETDEPQFSEHPVLGSKAVSFCQWTFMCKPRLPVMLRLIENIMIWIHKLARDQGKAIHELHLNFDEVLSGTGPSAFTNAILAQMTVTRGEKTTWENFHQLMDSKVVGGVLVLPSEAFAAGTGHSSSGNHAGSRSLVQHHFHASSWTSRHQRFKHPIYGEVEKCNWDPDCVKLWDANTAWFKALPEEEQLRMMEKKRLHSGDDQNEQVPIAVKKQNQL
ncbi:Glycosyltransferase family 32 protein [Teratosphaeria destructans]|uniref:Glycosyltransferase family 32 protein n=1 Tax=Teratosphaeria destructans TaxID=418781 RepID=A0A9W7T0Y5_9PEZI|nr:Glycosyltransferase family 32 protein [Teratosphaeria destructans]